MTATVSDEVLRGEVRDILVAAMQRVPDLAGRELTLRTLSGGITNRNYLVDAAGTDERWVIRLAGNDTHLLGISREVEHAATVAAAGVGVGPEVTAFIRPEGYLVTRFIEGSPVSDEAVHRPETIVRVAESLRRIHDGPAIPGLFVPFRRPAVASGPVPAGPPLLLMRQNCINHAVVPGIIGAHPEVALHVQAQPVGVLAGVLGQDLDLLLLEVEDLPGLDLDVRRLALRAP